MSLITEGELGGTPPDSRFRAHCSVIAVSPVSLEYVRSEGLNGKGQHFLDCTREQQVSEPAASRWGDASPPVSKPQLEQSSVVRGSGLLPVTLVNLCMFCWRRYHNLPGDGVQVGKAW